MSRVMVPPDRVDEAKRLLAERQGTSANASIEDDDTVEE
jgi:hypothetical protein